jgi:uncharacterized protein
MQVTDWTICGAEGETIFGNTHLPPPGIAPVGHLIIAHGFRGYKDYGILPVIDHHASRAGLLAHRFNFSHSGMTNALDTFERTDLFEKDTWSKQVEDIACVSNAIAADALPNIALACESTSNATADLPQFWFGHSRGGVSVLLAGARAFVPGEYETTCTSIQKPAGIIPCAAPAFACMMSDPDQQRLLSQGFLTIQSARTKQDLRIGSVWLTEINSAPNAFDPIHAAGLIECPMLVIHGDDDPTVPQDCAHLIADENKQSILKIVPDANHVFNTSNPAKLDRDPVPPAQTLLDATISFCLTHA